LNPILYDNTIIKRRFTRRVYILWFSLIRSDPEYTSVQLRTLQRKKMVEKKNMRKGRKRSMKM
jgi:hypothetical protein